MKSNIILLTAIVSVLTTSAMASNVVTSRTYVDSRDALKQDKIPVSGTNSSVPGDTVVTYTDTIGTIGERGIFDGSDGYDETNDVDKLITAGAVYGYVNGEISQIDIPEIPPTTETRTGVCVEWVANASHTDENCLLWALVNQKVREGQCQSNNDCSWFVCNPGDSQVCNMGYCECYSR